MTEDQSVVVSVDVGGTKILIGYVGRNGEIFHSQRYPMDRTTQSATLDSIDRALSSFMHAGWAGPAPLSIGVGLVGHVDTLQGIWLGSINMRISTPVALAAQLRERYGIPIAIDNDVHCAALAELRLGAGREAADFIYLNIGTGLSAGLVCNGRLVRGAANSAGELGHMVVEPNGDPCPCGRRGCLESIASGSGILNQIRTRLAAGQASCLSELALGGELSTDDVFRAADARDRLACEVTGRAISALEIGLTNLVNLLNPEKIVCGGGVVESGWYIQRVALAVAAGVPPGGHASFGGLFLSQLNPSQVGMIGAATIAWEGIEMTTPGKS